MKIRFTLVYEKEVSEKDRTYVTKAIKEEGVGSKFFMEYFNVGWDTPTEQRLEFV